MNPGKAFAIILIPVLIFEPQLYFANELLYSLGIACARLGVAFLYLRIFAEVQLRKVTKVFMVSSTLSVMIVAIWAIFLSRPIHMNWTVGVKGKRGDKKALYLAATIVGIASDAVTLLIPMPVIWRLRTRRSNKINLQGLFAFGLGYE